MVDSELRGVVAGGYKVLHKLGSGSFGEVYRCRHMQTGREVAVKFVKYADTVGTVDCKAQAAKTGSYCV